MKLEKLKRFNVWKWIGVVLIICVICVVVTFKVTQAKYRFTASYQAAYGTVHFKSSDLEVLAVNIENDSGGYDSSDTIPTSGYVLNETESYCGLSNGDGTYTNDTSITINYHDGVVGFDNITKKGTKCFLYFDIKKMTTLERILANNTIDTSRKSGSFSAVFTEDTAGRIFEGPADDYGDTTYFFAGANPNNWVKFAGFYWRIIRVNGNGSIRLIYNGTTTNQTGEGTQIGASAFNSSYNNNMYVGYMYTSGSVHGLGTSSTIKGVLDTWYQNNLASFSDKIDTDTGFCGDRQPSNSSSSLNGSGGTEKTATYYASYIRVFSTHQFTYNCAISSDLYTVSSSSYGNKALTYPIGLITVDEVNFAGLSYGGSNTSFYLYTNNYYWTMSPLWFQDGGALVFFISSYGELVLDLFVDESMGVRPVVNISSYVTLTGSGTSTDPYIVS